MLKPRQMIPAVMARGMDGCAVRAWDYKQKKNVVVVFLRAEEFESRAYVDRLAGAAEELQEKQAQVLVVFDVRPGEEMGIGLPEGILLASDVSGRAQQAYLGEDVFGPRGLGSVGVFVADRFGELSTCWVKARAAELPGVREVLSVLQQIELACEECGPPHWPAD